jgi:AraC-like DNA-binding protein
MTKSKGHPANAADAQLQIGPLMGIPELVTQLGGDMERVFQRSTLTPSAFSTPDNKVSFLDANRLMAMCVEETECEAFGFRLGREASPSALGLPGFMARAAPDVGTALQLLTDHLDLHDEGGAVSISSEAGLTSLAYRLHHPDNPVADQIYDLSMTMACNIMRALCGPQWHPVAVRLTAGHCPDRPAYKQFFRCPLEFGAPFAVLLFADAWLKQPISTADPMLLRHLQAEATAKESKDSPGTRDRLRALLPHAMATGDLSETAIARQLGICERTLHRRLQSEGTGFQRELKAFRYATACGLLADSDLPLAEIAAALGYADATVFSRAFKSWAGVTASQWRRTQGR